MLKSCQNVSVIQLSRELNVKVKLYESLEFFLCKFVRLVIIIFVQIHNL